MDITGAIEDGDVYENICPEGTAGCFSLLTFSWMGALIRYLECCASENSKYCSRVLCKFIAYSLKQFIKQWGFTGSICILQERIQATT